VASRVDSLRAIEVTFTATNGMTGTAERQRTVSRMIRLPNAGLRKKKTCGDEPLLGGPAFAAAFVPLAGGEPAINLTWFPATDENGGEKDVVRYVIWRRLLADLDWGEPYLSLPAGSANYLFTDAAVGSGNTYVYALAAQDCTPQTSNTVASLPVAVP
jgi:hypothetical protein